MFHGLFRDISVESRMTRGGVWTTPHPLWIVCDAFARRHNPFAGESCSLRGPFSLCHVNIAFGVGIVRQVLGNIGCWGWREN